MFRKCVISMGLNSNFRQGRPCLYKNIKTLVVENSLYLVPTSIISRGFFIHS